MPVTAADLKFFAAANMLDTPDGGGPRSANLVQNGVNNNVFPDPSATDRSVGRVHISKVYPSVTNADLAALLGASGVLNAVPTDPAVSVVLFRYGGALTTREQALAAFRLGAGSPIPGGSHTILGIGGTATATSATVTGVTFARAGWVSGQGLTDRYVLVSSNYAGWAVVPGSKNVIRRLLASTGGNATLDRAVPFSGPVTIDDITLPQLADETVAPRAYGSVATTAAVLSGSDAVVFAHMLAQVAGLGEGLALPIRTSGFGDLVTFTTVSGYGYVRSIGHVPVLHDGDIVTLWNEQATSAASQASGSTVDVGRTDLDQIAVVNAAGQEIARFMSNGPAPGVAGLAANLSTGIVTFSAGWTTQTVTVRHRIAHRSAINGVGIAGATLAVPVTRDFPSGSIITAHVPLGDMQARAYNMLAQQAWTRVWSDSVVGNPVAMMYSGTPVVTNQGAEDDRYAIVFKTGNTFDCYSERLGFVAEGDTATAFSPINPATGGPLCTLLAASWAPSILVGSVLRFNTAGACPPVWALRSVAPSSPTGTTSVALRLHGSVDA